MNKIILLCDYSAYSSPLTTEKVNFLYEKVYNPFLHFFLEQKIPSVHCFNGFTLESLKKLHLNNFIQDLKNSIKENLIEVGIKGYSDAPLSYLYEEDLVEQITLGKNVLFDILGIENPKLFYPAEGWIDPLAISIIRKLGFEYTILENNIIKDNYSKEVYYNISKILGLFKKELFTFIIYENKENTIIKSIKNILTGKQDVKEVVNKVFKELEKLKDIFIILKIDLQSILYSSNPLAGIQRFKFFIQCLQDIGNISFSTLNKIYKNYPLEKANILYCNIPYFKRLDILLKEAREIIKEKKKKKGETVEIIKSWKKALLGQDIHAIRLALTKNFTKSTYEYYLNVCENLWRVKKKESPKE